MITVGSRVVMNDNYYVPERYRGKVFTVRIEPITYDTKPKPTTLVWLDGVVGGYCLDGLTEVDDDGKPIVPIKKRGRCYKLNHPDEIKKGASH